MVLDHPLGQSARMTNPRIIIVTGGTSGIGRATAEALVATGATVVIAARDAERGRAVARDLGCMFVCTDVSEPEAVGQLIEETVARHGRLDGALNNAAAFTSGTMAPLADVSIEAFDRDMAINLRGLWLCMRAQIRQMLNQGAGAYSIVNTSSINGLGGAPYGSTYSAAKAAILALTKSAAVEYAPQGLRINALVPGTFETPLLNAALDAVDTATGTPGAARHATIGRIPLGRIGAPHEAASAAVWLLSDAASYVTGASFIVDGGMTCLMR